MMKKTAELLPYPDRFLTPKAAETYVREEYAADSYATAIWAEQVPLIRKLLQEVRQNDPVGRHFDFACGTGRITRLTEEFFAEVDALDISAAMVEVARAAGRQARFFVGNILESTNLCLGPYGSITTFRLILNIDPPLRVPVLIQLRRRLKPDGVLIFNVHGNRHSLRQPALIWNRLWRRYESGGVERLLNTMSRAEVEACLATAGFRVEQVYGIGILPQTVYRWPLNSLWRRLDLWLSSLTWLKRFSIDLIFVCKKKDTGSL
jgi:SAM-dependent methyltransferase